MRGVLSIRVLQREKGMDTSKPRRVALIACNQGAAGTSGECCDIRFSSQHLPRLRHPERILRGHKRSRAHPGAVPSP